MGGQWSRGGDGSPISDSRRSELWPYVAAIRYPEILDWRRHLSPNLSQDEKESKIRELQVRHANLPVEISDGLYLSDAVGAADFARLKDLGITHVLNVGGDEASLKADEDYDREGIVRKTIHAKDEHGYPMLKLHLDETRQFVIAANKQGRCIIHCAQGVNRSGVLVAALTMLKERRNVLDVVLHCRTQRGNWFLNTNETFQEEFVELAKREGLLGPSPGENGCVVDSVVAVEIPAFPRSS